jgi:hypothetical protein
LFIEPVSYDFVDPDPGDISCLVDHKTQDHFSLKFCLASFFGKIGWESGYAFGRVNTILMVVVDLVVRNDVIGATELRLGAFSGIFTKEKDTAQNGLRVLKGFERPVGIYFYLLGLAEADENALAIYFLVRECSERTFHPQSVRREV